MELPKLEKKTFKVEVDNIEIELCEPTLPQISKLSQLQNLSQEKDVDVMINGIADVLISLMDTYTATKEEKKEFIKKMSLRQIIDIVSGLVDSLKVDTQKKVITPKS